MLKKRIIAVLVVQNGIVVQSVGFRRFLPVGRPEISIEFFNQWGVDEIILLDISATAAACGPDLEMVRRAAARCRSPLAVGGGIHTLGHARELVRNGADKLVFNQAGRKTPELLSQVADIFGSQCVVGALDGIRTGPLHQVYDYLLGTAVPQTPAQLAKDLVRRGCGEIFVNSVDHDGQCCGFDLPLIQSVRETVDVPMICCGGAGCPHHFVEVFQKIAVQGAAAANFFHYTEHSVTVTKEALRRAGIEVRHDTHADYSTSPLDKAGRPRKKADQILEEMLFVRFSKEVI